MADSLSFDRIADRYDATRKYPADVSERIAAGLLARTGRTEGVSLLEIGIGTGRIALPLLAAGAHVTGVDISARMLERLHAKYTEMRVTEPERTWGRLITHAADATALPFADGAFDAVVAAHVMHLISRWELALDEALRVARPAGGVLLCQDMRSGDDIQIRAQDVWLDVAKELGHEPSPGGAASTRHVVDAMRWKGCDVSEGVLATWTVWHTPRETLRWVAEREWSRTWDIPEPAFSETVRRLTQWMEAEYGSSLDVPYPATTSVYVAQIRPAGWRSR